VLYSDVIEAPRITRVFKTSWFAKEVKKVHIKDMDLCEAINEVEKGQCDDLGGEVYKKRLNKNLHRSIVISKGGLNWIYQYLFAKKDRDNIDGKELEGFRKLAKGYAGLTEQQLVRLLVDKDLTEICNGDEKKIQK